MGSTHTVTGYKGIPSFVKMAKKDRGSWEAFKRHHLIIDTYFPNDAIGLLRKRQATFKGPNHFIVIPDTENAREEFKNEFRSVIEGLQGHDTRKGKGVCRYIIKKYPRVATFVRNEDTGNWEQMGN